MHSDISIEFPQLTVHNFENFLTSDHLFVHTLNRFLSLPCFPQALLYNEETDQFEVPSDAAEFTFNKIRSALEYTKSQILHKNVKALAKTPLVDNSYAVSCLDRKQGIQWIIKERLTFFLQSSCYHEYRLSKLLFQWARNINIDRSTCNCRLATAVLSDKEGFRAHKNNSSKQDIQVIQMSEHKLMLLHPCKGRVRIHQLLCTSSGHSAQVHRNVSESSRRSSKLSTTSSTSFASTLYGADVNTREASDAAQDKQIHEEASELDLQNLAARIVQQVVDDAVFMLTAQNHKKCTCIDKKRKCMHWHCSLDENTKKSCKECQKCSRGNDICDGNKSKMSEASSDTETVQDVCCHGGCYLGNQPGMNDFKEFLRGTTGGRLLSLWMDIERLKTLNRERENSFLALMRSRYLLSSSQNSLRLQQLCRFGLTTSPCWTKERLCSVQPKVMESITSYWVPRYWTSPQVQVDLNDPDREGCVSPYLASMTPSSPCPEPWLLLPYNPQFCEHSHPSRSQSLGHTRLEKVLQALFVDPEAGSYFTHFCEQSGNQLWENAVYFWNDLQHYHELFYQDGLDPYRVQRIAQVICSTYLHSSASRSIGMKEEIRIEVYNQLMPAFEELFDKVEDHILNILMEAWTALVDLDTKVFLQVDVYKNVRCVNTWQFRELQSLYAEFKQNKHQQQITSPLNTASGLFSQGHRELESWSNVPAQYQGYRLGSLLRHHHESWHFMSFLRNKDASIHLECWLDLEQYRQTPQRNKALTQDRSSHIAKKYLNTNYFFSSQSPATEEQQNHILHLAGGLELLQFKCLSKPVTVEIQEIIRCHIEKKWLPEFLATAEFRERRKRKAKDSAHRHKTRKEGWKVRRHAQRGEMCDLLHHLASSAGFVKLHFGPAVNFPKWDPGWTLLIISKATHASPQSQGLWMSSSKEIFLFRRLLLNPASCLHFQHFVSPKGDFLENDVLFWLEVQRYKDLCHSHSDEATIEQKISTIIKCFINSSSPPALQIDIPLEQAKHIMEKRHKLGPYIFREAQMSVFSELLRFWPKFQELRSSVHEGQLLEMLQDERVKHKARVRRQRRKEEEEDERRAQEEYVKRLTRSSSENDDTQNENDKDVEKRASQTTSSLTLFSPKPFSWSYSKYMAALKRNERLLKRQSQKEASFSTYSVSSDGSVTSTGRKGSHQKASRPSSKSHVKESH
ncbi:regulator of G-protein signaling 22 [Syngnathus scovelli]|uniref:regulator of G-protein signaling 22 n=1 Tax=Syngnathus scovelli TaxID=161590 RepID=UPI002110146C|nr:regulator of G-protein signaling 22 [Syngnathus scovelli]